MVDADVHFRYVADRQRGFGFVVYVHHRGRVLHFRVVLVAGYPCSADDNNEHDTFLLPSRFEN